MPIVENPEKYIIASTRMAVGLEPEGEDFKIEILMHIKAALSVLNQNGIGNELNTISITDTTTWTDFYDSLQTLPRAVPELIPMFVYLKTKILFDPPPPSNVEFYKIYIEEMLWRLKVAFEYQPIVVNPIVIEEGY
jgi:hypothetical protein